MRNDRSESLNRFLDELAHDPVASGQEIEPELRATVHWFRDLGTEPTPNPAFRARLEHDLMSHVFEAPMPAALAPSVASPVWTASGRRRPSVPPPDRPKQLPRWRWNVVPAAAAMLLFALGLAYVAFGQLRPDSNRPRAIPAAFIQATPDIGVNHELLLAVTLPAETIPPGQPLAMGWHITFAPGAIAAVPASLTERGVAAETVLEGTYAVRVDAPTRVIRAGGAVEEIAAGTETLLGPGDAVLYLDASAAQAYHNPGTTKTVVVGVSVVTNQDDDRGIALDGATGVILAPFGQVDATDWAQVGFVAGPLSVSLQRVTVAPGGIMPVIDESVPTLRYVESGNLTWVPAGSAATPSGPAGMLVIATGQYVPWMPSEPDRTPVQRNDGAEPLVVLELTIGPAASDPATPAP